MLDVVNSECSKYLASYVRAIVHCSEESKNATRFNLKNLGHALRPPSIYFAIAHHI